MGVLSDEGIGANAMIDSRSGNRTQTLPSPPTAQEVFRFGPHEIVRALSFHLLDEELATQIKRKSVRRTVARLNREIGCLAIPKGDWAAMSDPQRLEWLLEESHTAVEITEDGTAILHNEE
jgi:hypothetical protein